MSAIPEDIRLIEAVLFASAEPLDEQTLAAYVPGRDIKDILRRLSGEYEPRGVTLRQTGQRWAFRTAPDLADRLGAFSAAPVRLTRAVTETLAIIAYHQPVTRAEIEQVRGVATHRGALDTLLELGWIKPGRRRQTIGRPGTWVTTPAFLDHFGLASLADLPGLDELKASGLLDTRPVTAMLFDRLEEETVLE
jgi:segregation and condensation protein B